MRYTFILVFLLFSRLIIFAQNSTTTPAQYKQDFEYFWTTINDEYCYFETKQINWQLVKKIYTPALDTITTRNQFVELLEKTLNELYDHHAILNTNTSYSRRLVPSGTDTWAEYINGKPMITELRKGFGAATSGMIAGMEVIAVNDIPVDSAMAAFLPKALKPLTNEAKSFALRLLLAGNHIQPRKFTVKYRGIEKDYFPDKNGLGLEQIQYAGKIESKLIGNTGYIRINDCLYDNELIPVFDSVMHTLKNTSSLIIDLRETPSGGNTSVARAILGWFITKDHFFQKHEYYAEEKSSGIKRSWVEIVSPRKNKYYGKPLVILCNHWTGSIAEGIVIGFDAFNRPNTKIMGPAMARLRGAVYTFEMPNTKIRFTFPNERLFHVNGLPREQFIPPAITITQKDTATDLYLSKALQFLRNK
jgi:C-terminal processing protease CtpA/Prc